MKTLSKKLMSYLMATITVISLMTLLAFSSSAASISIPKGAKEYKGHSYYVYSGQYTWKKAKSLCEKKGGHLVVITSKKENEFVAKLIDKKDIGFCWLGATDEKKEGEWIWVDGTKMKFKSWAYNQPDDYRGNEDYITSYPNATEWNDNSGDKNDEICGYVCEWDMTKAEAKKPMLNKSKASLYYGATTTLKMLNTKETAKWSSSNKKVATVSSKGKVTAKGLGTATITAKIGKKSYKCKVTVKDRNVGSAIGFVTDGGGYFIKGSSIARVTFRPKNYGCAKAIVTIKSAAGDTVLTKTYTNLKKNTNYTFTWDGKNSSGIDAYAGSYRVSVKIGNTTSYSPYLAFKTVNEFGGGSGSASNPFKVTATEQLPKIVKYPEACFIQMNDLDFGYSSAGGYFTEDQPFRGTYNGNGKTIYRITATDSLFAYLGEKGTIMNLNMSECSVINEYGGLLVRANYGNIKNCNISGTVSYSNGSYDSIWGGIIVSGNSGTITNCTASGTCNYTADDDIFVGGVVGANHSTGKIIACTSSANALVTGDDDCYAGGICGKNSGFITNCEASGNMSRDSWSGAIGGVAGKNENQILNCYYTGAQTLSIAGSGDGVVA